MARRVKDVPSKKHKYYFGQGPTVVHLVKPRQSTCIMVGIQQRDYPPRDECDYCQREIHRMYVLSIIIDMHQWYKYSLISQSNTIDDYERNYVFLN